MITAAVLAAFGAVALATPASAAPAGPAPATAFAGAQDSIVNVRWHPIRRMRQALHRHRHHRM
jgi:hypothetical protein